MDGECEADYIMHDAMFMTNSEFSNEAISTTSRQNSWPPLGSHMHLAHPACQDCSTPHRPLGQPSCAQFNRDNIVWSSRS